MKRRRRRRRFGKRRVDGWGRSKRRWRLRERRRKRWKGNKYDLQILCGIVRTERRSKGRVRCIRFKLEMSRGNYEV